MTTHAHKHCTNARHVVTAAAYMCDRVVDCIATMRTQRWQQRTSAVGSGALRR